MLQYDAERYIRGGKALAMSIVIFMNSALQLRYYRERQAVPQCATPDATLRLRYAPALATRAAGELHRLGPILFHYFT